MFNKFKRWLQRCRLGECEATNMAEASDDFNYYPRDEDPREVPRPKKYPNLDLPISNSELQQEVSCWCYNCRQLSHYLKECAICRESLSSSGIWSCSHCSNMTCWLCALRLPLCPFCRSVKEQPLIGNTAIHRILAKLDLPCPPPSLTETETAKSRADDVSCPSVKSCQWRGQLPRLQHHLETEHDITLLEGVGITIEISRFRWKVAQSELRGQVYVVALHCHEVVFSCSVSLHKRRLCLSLCGVAPHHHKFGAWLEVSSWFRTMTGILPLSVGRSGRHKELYISCEGLLSPWNSPPEDTLKICITIRPLC